MELRKKSLITLACLAMACIVLFAMPSTKDKAIAYVLEHQEALEAFVLSIPEKEQTDQVLSYDSLQVYSWASCGLVEFEMSSWGIVPASAYEGFYYSPEDKPMGFQGIGVQFTPEGAGWAWREASGDNRQYTERITAHWYWYKAIF